MNYILILIIIILIAVVVYFGYQYFFKPKNLLLEYTNNKIDDVAPLNKELLEKDESKKKKVGSKKAKTSTKK